MTDWTEDKDNDGVPDAIEEVLEDAKASLMSRTFTKRNMYMSIIFGLIIAGYGLFAYMYLSLRDEKIAIQNQFDWFKSEQEIEINKAVIEERKRVLIELDKQFDGLNDDLTERRTNVNLIQNAVLNKPYARSNEDEVNEMDISDLDRSFNDLGFPTSK